MIKYRSTSTSNFKYKNTSSSSNIQSHYSSEKSLKPSYSSEKSINLKRINSQPKRIRILKQYTTTPKYIQLNKPIAEYNYYGAFNSRNDNKHRVIPNQMVKSKVSNFEKNKQSLEYFNKKNVKFLHCYDSSINSNKSHIKTYSYNNSKTHNKLSIIKK